MLIAGRSYHGRYQSAAEKAWISKFLESCAGRAPKINRYQPAVVLHHYSFPANLHLSDIAHWEIDRTSRSSLRPAAECSCSAAKRTPCGCTATNRHLCRLPTQTSLSTRDLDRKTCDLWLERGKRETGKWFHICHDWMYRVVDPDLRADMRYMERRPLGCVCRSVVFRLFAWPCVVVLHATNLVRDGAHG
jgi:hypothetical protein